MSALEVRQLEHTRAFAGDDAPPARLAFYQQPAAAPPPVAGPGLTALGSLLRITDPDLRTLLDTWLAGVYTATDVTAALSQRADLPPRARYVVKQGHLVDAHRSEEHTSEPQSLMRISYDVFGLQKK